MMALCLGILVSTPIANAESLKHGGHTIYYTTFPSTIIPADVANTHNIVRAPNRMVVNISARKAGDPAVIGVEGMVTNLLEQQTSLPFTEVKEQNAIYYLASYLALEQDLLRFSITVTPPGEDSVNFEILRRFD